MLSTRSEKAGRCLTYASSGVVFAISVAVLLLIQLLPESSSQVSRHVFIYAAFSSLMSLAGLLGAYKRNATWISVFVNYLLLDAVVFTIPRLLLLTYAGTIPSNFCARAASPKDGIHNIQLALRASPAYAQHHMRRIERVEAWASGLADLSHGQCVGISWVVVGLLGVLVMGLTVAQWFAAFKVRRYGRQISQEGELARDQVRDCDCDRGRGEYVDWLDKSPAMWSVV